ncbi:PREDICTED: uncharacterized protein LOC109341097 [Lupinus angustifolius]|uniref:uncharacterized protein LOC109341097 n=1 Tax=Lupinus angustifolius TaxID=3871 RepID=UPI00092F1735|nr:PREDICTED: uncharacterized protein LOC109341097 [Lupinus angustifolius]
MGNRIEVFSHLLQKGFPRKYTFWYMHGEKHVQDNVETIAQPQEEWVRQYPMQDMLDDVFGIFDDSGIQDSGHSNIPNDDQPRGDASKAQQEKIKEQLGDGNEELYPGCKKYSKISFIVLLYHIKVLCSATDKTFSMIIDLLNDAFPHAKLPASLYEAKKLIKKLGLSYEKIHACPNNCMLYWGSLEDKKRDNCKICNASRWKSNGNISGANDIVVGQNKKYIPAKVLRYFPLIPRLQRLYMCSKTAELLKWHAKKANPDGLVRHPRDSKAWKEFDKMYPDFALDSRNIRLALATDDFNPFGTLSSKNSIWPVMLYAYNYSPWYCMKQTSLIMSMIIPGPKMPGNSIDVYLQPLVSELQKLWKGVEAYDSSTKESFQMRASLFCTISDFPGLDNLSGWNTHTSLACPSCNFDTESKWLKFGGKYCFMGHRRYLPLDHKYRINKSSFDGSIELRPAPIPPPGSNMLRDIESGRKRPRDEVKSENNPPQWKKKGIFWDLPYWKYLLIRHCLDMMHIEKNVGDNVLFTILDDKSRTKDNLKARKDLHAMGIREKLHPYPNSSKFPPSCFKMKNQEKDIFLKILKSVVFPDSFSSNISRCVDLKKRKISGLKSHDTHILMEHIFPIAFRRSLPKEVTSVLIELCNYFRELSSKVLNVKYLEKLQQRIALTLCHMEMIFPPSFFTIMVHLVIHLGEEAMIAGPVHYRWMYPIERTLGHLKSYVRNKAAPEGCIAEGYIMEESLTFCSRYFLNGDIETRFNRPRRNDDDIGVNVFSESTIFSNIFPTLGKHIGVSKIFSLPPIEKLQAHRYVLTNCQLVDTFREKCKTEVTRMHRGQRNSTKVVEEYVHKHFHEWFKEYLCLMARSDNDTNSDSREDNHEDDIAATLADKKVSDAIECIVFCQCVTNGGHSVIEECIYYLHSLKYGDPNKHPTLKEMFTRWTHVKTPYETNTIKRNYYVLYFMKESF